MKFVKPQSYGGDTASLPARGVWIEIKCHPRIQKLAALSLPARGVWIEIILYGCALIVTEKVTPREGSVD